MLGGTRRRRDRGNAEDTEGEGRAGVVGKRGRQGEEGGEEEGGETTGQEDGETVEKEEQRGRVKVSGVVVLWSLVVHP